MDVGFGSVPAGAATGCPREPPFEAADGRFYDRDSAGLLVSRCCLHTYMYKHSNKYVYIRTYTPIFKYVYIYV